MSVNPSRSAAGDSHLSIGEVLNILREEFHFENLYTRNAAGRTEHRGYRAWIFSIISVEPGKDHFRFRAGQRA